MGGHKRLGKLDSRVILPKQFLGNFGFLGDFEATLYSEHQIYQSCDYSVLWIEGQYLEKDLARVHLFKRLQRFE